MKKTFLLFYCSFLVLILPKDLFSQNVGIGTSTPNASAMLDVQSTNKGLLPPRMTSLQRDAISSPTPGLIIFNTDTQSLEVFTNTGWAAIKKTNFAIEKLLGGNAEEAPSSIEKTTDGGYILSGESKSSANGDVTGISHGLNEYWIVKLNAAGNISWNKLLGGSGIDVAYMIAQTSDGGYIVSGYSNSSANGDVTGTTHGAFEYWVVKLDATGSISWNKLLGGNGNEISYSIQQTTDGGYIIAGYSSSSANGDVTGTNHGSIDYWIVKLDAAGNISWNKLLGGNADERPNSIQQTTDGGYIIAGYSSSSANGDVTGTNHGLIDYWVVKLDAAGNVTWNKLLGGSNDDVANSIKQTTDGGYIVAGYSKSSATGDVTANNHGLKDYWIVKLDPAGNVTWNKLLGGFQDEVLYTILQSSDGGYIVSGDSKSSASGDVTVINHGNLDYWIVKLDATGNISWNKLLGGVGMDTGCRIQKTINGDYIIAGYSESSFNGDVTGINHGLFDYWIVKLNSAGNIIQQ